MKTTTKRVRETFEPGKFSPWKREDIQLIASELKKIEESEGEVRPSRIVKLAADPSHALHRFIFGDSNADAAAKWRLELARRMCRAVQLVYLDDDDKAVASAPMLVSVVPDTNNGNPVVRQRRYISVERAFADPSVRKAMLKEALAQAESWEQRYRSLNELQPVFAALRSVRKSHR